MRFIADFHIHSKFSRATSADLDLGRLHAAAQIKGIQVLGTGDFTHPAWWQEINEQLVPAEEGLFALKPGLAEHFDRMVPQNCRAPVRFTLVTEISNIYKKDGRTRKNHNLVFMPDLAAADRFRQRLDKIGNIRSDGRPILGLAARDLLEIVLEASPHGYLVPAHIWTPWFSLLGSKSGFDAVEECFDDLSHYIFALETGLSSDPPMNWRLSVLDRYTLISNSDAHSPAKLGREANCFDCDLNFAAIRGALDQSMPGAFLGTLEFFPEEGKYHLDGHRKCNVRSLPAQTRAAQERCPACGKPLTLGVLYRVEALADRPQALQPKGAAGFQHLVPLQDLLAHVCQTGPQSKRVAQAYESLLQRLGSEFDILRTIPCETIASSGQPLLAEALRRMRCGQVRFEPGYDGEFGRLKLFDTAERLALCGQNNLFDISCPAPSIAAPWSDPPPLLTGGPCAATPPPADASAWRLNSDQQAALDHGRGPLMIVAGPGTGKTRTITCRMAALIHNGTAAPEQILAVTFTNRAADEMRARLKATLDPHSALPLIATFHGLCWRLLREIEAQRSAAAIADETLRRAVLHDALQLLKDSGEVIAQPAAALLEQIVQAKQCLLGPRDDLGGVAADGDPICLSKIYAAYQELLDLQGFYDFEDLILVTVRHLASDRALRCRLRRRFSHIVVDEFQDINYGQYELLRLLAPPAADICVIGDPEQAIYGFRGSDVRYFGRFQDDYSPARVIRLTRNYRSTETILGAAAQVIQSGVQPSAAISARTYSNIAGYEAVTLLESASAQSEAVAIGRSIEALVGGTGYHALGFGSGGDLNQAAPRSFSDFAVLYRTREQGALLADILQKAGLPCQRTDSAEWLQQRAVAKLLALLRLFAGQGNYADLATLSDLISPALSKATLVQLKRWAYAKRIPVAQALQAALRLPLPELTRDRQQRLVQWIRRMGEIKKETDGMDVVTLLAHLAECLVAAQGLAADALARLTAVAQPFDKDVAAFLTALSLQRDTDLYHPRAEKIALLTMHAAKGLEFPVVYIAGCEAGLIPFERPGEALVEEEERRLFYVAMTRAGQRLFLSWARQRSRHGRPVACRPSPFLTAIETRLKEYDTQPRGRPKPAQLELF
jgi:DNA helicase II / ATP-dependent DNA helicase PcrA